LPLSPDPGDRAISQADVKAKEKTILIHINSTTFYAESQLQSSEAIRKSLAECPEQWPAIELRADDLAAPHELMNDQN
jgi:hypothetical protein